LPIDNPAVSRRFRPSRPKNSYAQNSKSAKLTVTQQQQVHQKALESQQLRMIPEAEVRRIQEELRKAHEEIKR
jgi:hypothetical protein